MVLLGWCWAVTSVLFKVFFILWFIAHAVCLFLPRTTPDWLESVDDFVLSRFASIPVLLTNAWLVAAQICYFIGNFFALVLISFGAFIVSYSVYLKQATLQFTFDGAYQLAEQLAGDKVAWSGATMLVAATVAICNMWKLNLDRKQYFEKREKEFREQIAKKEEERRNSAKSY